MRRLIVNADDFGRTVGVNRGIVRAYEEGIVTSASLMTEQPAAEEAAAYAHARPQLSVGLHVDLGEWAFRSGEWSPVYERGGDRIPAEAGRQLERFRALVRRDPTHLDSHQHVHLREPARSALLGLAVALGVPLRHFDERVRYCGEFFGQTDEGEPIPGALSVERLAELLAGLPEGMTELACHPGDPVDLESSYCEERALEVEALCDPRVLATLEREGIELCSFAEVSG